MEKYKPEEQKLVYSDKYYMFRDRWGRKLSYNMYWNSNHATFIAGISRWGKTVTTNEIVQGEINCGKKIIYDNFKGEPLPFDSHRIDANKVQYDISLLSINDWINLTHLEKGPLFDLRRTIKHMIQYEEELTFENLEKEIEKQIKSKMNVASIMNALYDLQDEDLLSEKGFNILELMNKHQVVEIDCSKNPEMRLTLIPHICHIIMMNKQNGVIPRNDEIVMAFDEIADPEYGVGNTTGAKTIMAPVKRIFTGGGYFHVYGIANTQLPQDTNSQIIGNCTDRIIHRLTSDNAIKKVSNTVNVQFSYLKNILPYLQKGECLFLRGELQQVRKVIKS